MARKKEMKMRQMRKVGRMLPTAEAYEILERAPYVTVSMVRPDGRPYGVPLSLVRGRGDVFYFHCAGEGEKLDCLRHDPVVALSAVSRCTPRFEEDKKNFTMYYRSAMAVGRAEIVEGGEEKVEALRLICERFLPQHMDEFDAAIDRSLSRTTIVKITLTEPPVGKSKHAEAQMDITHEDVSQCAMRSDDGEIVQLGLDSCGD